MSILTSISGAVAGALIQEGRALLHTKYPDDIEYYAITLELTDSNNRTLESLTFPVLPNSISFNAPNTAHIKRSMGGITILDTPTYTPSEITLQGTFGRKFKYMFGRTGTNGGDEVTKGEALHLGRGVKEFSKSVKNGYGITKVLEYIIRRAQEVDKSTGETNRLFLYNLTLNNHYLVQPVNMQLHQDVGSNMIWNYQLQFRTLAYTYYVKTDRELKKHLSEIMRRDIVSKFANKIGAKVASEVLGRVMSTAMSLKTSTGFKGELKANVKFLTESFYK